MKDTYTSHTCRVADFYSTNEKILSLEFFPPKKEELIARTKALMEELSTLGPHYMTVTYGAGGSTRGFTQTLVQFIHEELKTPAVAHLTCVGHSRDDIDGIVDRFHSMGIQNILALRGDPPREQEGFRQHPEGFRFAADLIRHLRARNDLCLLAAGYPEKHSEAPSWEADIDNLKAKIDAGASVVLTQLFLDPSFYFSYLERTAKAGVHVPIVPGILPISDAAQLKRFATLCGVHIPSEIQAACEKFAEDREALQSYGVELAVSMCKTLLEGGAPGIHLYTLNNPRQARAVIEGTGISKNHSSSTHVGARSCGTSI